MGHVLKFDLIFCVNHKRTTNWEIRRQEKTDIEISNGNGKGGLHGLKHTQIKIE